MQISGWKVAGFISAKMTDSSVLTIMHYPSLNNINILQFPTRSHY